MRQTSLTNESPSERIVKNIRRATRKRYLPEEKIRSGVWRAVYSWRTVYDCSRPQLTHTEIWESKSRIRLLDAICLSSNSPLQ